MVRPWDKYRKIGRKKNWSFSAERAVFTRFRVQSTQKVFTDHHDGLNEGMFTGDHLATLMKLIAERYIPLRLYTYGKRFSGNIAGAGKSTIRHQLTKLILFRRQ